MRRVFQPSSRYYAFVRLERGNQLVGVGLLRYLCREKAALCRCSDQFLSRIIFSNGNSILLLHRAPILRSRFARNLSALLCYRSPLFLHRGSRYRCYFEHLRFARVAFTRRYWKDTSATKFNPLNCTGSKSRDVNCVPNIGVNTLVRN